MATIYDSEGLYIQSATDLQDKICKIEKIIDALLNVAENAAGNENIDHYTLDDGQTKISATYRSMKDVLGSIQAYEKLKQIYIHRLEGRGVQLRDVDNFRSRQ